MSVIGRCSLAHLKQVSGSTDDPFLKQHGLQPFASTQHWELLIQQPGFPPVDAVLLSFYSNKKVMVLRGEGQLPGVRLSHDSVVDYVDQLLQYCAAEGLSDIHIQPQESGIIVRGRIAGELSRLDVLPPDFGLQVYSRIKVLANLDLTELRQPQDGRLSVRAENSRQHEFRLSCCPVIGGEKLVLRCLQPTQSITPLQQTGLLDAQYQWFAHCLSQPQGLILVTGPTGSGKTSTLYSAISQLDAERCNICSVEDPVEVPLPGCSQVMVNHKQGLTFASVLRALLRQDPDVMLIGEIRDSETAKIAVQAAQTGHLVLTSMHTNSCLDSLKRLQSLGINPLDIRSSLSLIVSQRLFPVPATAENKRQAVFEVVPWQEQAEKFIDLKTNTADLRRYLESLQLPDFSQALQNYIDAGQINRKEKERFTYDAD